MADDTVKAGRRPVEIMHLQKADEWKRFGYLNEEIGVYLNSSGVPHVVIEHEGGYVSTEIMSSIRFLDTPKVEGATE